MKININRNILWSETFFNKLSDFGVRYACISPGSRNTPLTIALARSTKIKSYVQIDERSSGFFALGLARATASPVLLICTSGTAVAEFYPAIIEAFQQRIPLIVCTADRPPELIGKGANQTIYQDNIYRNHIRWFINAGLPEPTKEKLEFICRLAERSVTESSKDNIGPVHINFPFRKPFEPFAYTDEVDSSLLETALGSRNRIFRQANSVQDALFSKESIISEIFSFLLNSKNGLIIAGPANYSDVFINGCNKLATQLNFPVIADGASQLRLQPGPKPNILVNFESYMRSGSFLQGAHPEIVIQFGRTPTSKAMELFLEKLKVPYYIINEFGEWHDPYNNAKATLKLSPESFCEKVLSMLKRENFKPSIESEAWLQKFLRAECLAEEFKKEMIENSDFPFEGRILTELIKSMPDNSNLMVSNSMPIRDLDYFAPKSDKSIRIFHNRGASGIDGIISTALGIAEGRPLPTVLLTGDLAFYYDLNGLLASLKYSIPLIIILINNNGGGIFEMLPVSGCDDVLKDYFTTPHDLDFSHFVKGYSGDFYQVESWDQFHEIFDVALERKKLSVIQINTDAKQSTALRREYWKKVGENL